MVVVVLLVGRVREELLPEPRAAYVAIEAAGRPATVGAVAIGAAAPFTLHAVLEAETARGERIFYTEAPRLLLGGAEVAPDSLRRWERAERVQILWFTVEGTPPYLEVATAEELGRLRFREVFRADWAKSWAVAGSVEPSRRRQEAGRLEPLVSGIGTQRYQVRIELFVGAAAIVPARRFTSWGAAELADESLDFPTVTAALAEPLATPSGVFGLAQVEPVGGQLPAIADEIARLTKRRLAFSRLVLLRQVLDRAGRGWDELDWRAIDLAAGPAWGAGGVAPGDLLRVGERFVILAEDRGEPGRLDAADVGFDYDRGATVRRLDEIFVGGGLVEWAAVDTAGGR